MIETSTVSLPATKTNAVRSSTFQRITPTGKPVAGILQVEEARTAGGKVTTRRYAVCELEHGSNGRRFRLSKPLAARRQDEEAEYVVYLPFNRGFDKCVCRAWTATGKCVHCDALRAHMRQGNVPPVTEPKLPPPPPKPDPAAALEFPNSPTINPAAIKDYWSKVNLGPKSDYQPPDFYHPWGKKTVKRKMKAKARSRS